MSEQNNNLSCVALDSLSKDEELLDETNPVNQSHDEPKENKKHWANKGWRQKISKPTSHELKYTLIKDDDSQSLIDDDTQSLSDDSE